MDRKRYTAGQIIHKPREAEVDLATGRTVPEVARKLGISEQFLSSVPQEVYSMACRAVQYH